MHSGHEFILMAVFGFEYQCFCRVCLELTGKVSITNCIQSTGVTFLDVKYVCAYECFCSLNNLEAMISGAS